MKKSNSLLIRRRERKGLLFILPFLIGLIFFFIFPMIQSLTLSFSANLLNDPSKFVSVGFKNYKDAFMKDTDFRKVLVKSISAMLFKTPVITIFSFFCALLLNQKFHGRTIARAIFFLPVIISANSLGNFAEDYVVTLITDKANDSFDILGYEGIKNFFYQMNLSPRLLNYVTTSIEQIYNIVLASGVQILIFLAGLQSVSPSLYEASDIEGATKWESFWKITFPMVSSMIFVNIIYTIIDSFANDPIITHIHGVEFLDLEIGYGSALSWIYFIVVSVFVGVIAWIISRKVFYYE